MILSPNIMLLNILCHTPNPKIMLRYTCVYRSSMLKPHSKIAHTKIPHTENCSHRNNCILDASPLFLCKNFNNNAFSLLSENYFCGFTIGAIFLVSFFSFFCIHRLRNECIFLYYYICICFNHI